MPLPARASSRALYSSIGQCERIIARRAAAGVGAGAAAQQRRWESTDQKKGDAEGNAEGLGKSFKGQLYVSTANRLIKERAERQRFAIERGEDSSGRTWSITFTILAAALGGYWLGKSRNRKPDTSSTSPLAGLKGPQHNIAGANMEAAWADFVEIVGKAHVSTQETDRANRASSDWSSHIAKEGEMPFMVVFPETTEQVSKIMKVCHTRRIPVTAYSGGTSLEGHFATTRGGICLDFARMGKILEVHRDDMDVVVQPGVGWEMLNAELAKSNLFFPPDPGPGAMIGGMVGTGCSGTNAYRYGTMREWVLSLTVVLADGTVIKTRQRPRKSSAGYDLTKMFIGSEGTLGLVTEATLKVTTKPISTSVAVCSFATIRQAADCVAKVVSKGVPIAAIEILDDVQMACINSTGGTTKSWAEAPTLFFKFSGTPAAVKEQIGIVKALANRTGSKTFEFAKNQAEQDELWSARKVVLWSVASLKEDGDHVWTGDVAVPISRLPDIIEETKEDARRSGIFTSIVGHVGDGNFHTIMLYNDSQRETAKAVVHRMVKRAVEMEGTVTGEHGVGLLKRDYLEHELGATTVDAMRKLKLAFDPLCLLNCDKVVRVEKPKDGEVSAW